MAPQGLFFYNGAKALFSGTFTLTPGISPSVCTLSIAPVGAILQQGTLTISYGGTNVRFNDCIVDKLEAIVGDDGFTVWSIDILDRRWKWRDMGTISGYYNTRSGDKNEIKEGTEKTPQELARMCLNALGESSYDVSRLPNDARPEIEWEYESPAEALAQLCDELGCVVVLNTRDKVTIERLNTGPKLPRLSNLRNYSELFDPPEAPDSLVVVCGRNRYELEADLEAVGVEADGEIKKIDDLTYKPKEGWGNVDPIYFNAVTDAKKRELAIGTVWKWYRIKAPFKLAGQDTVNDIDRILPIEDKQIKTKMVLGKEEPLEPEVFGVFYNRKDDTGSFFDEVKRDLEKHPQAKYTGGFSIDRERGIVKFSEPVYKLTIDEDLPSGSVVAPAEIRLRTACSLRDEETRAWVRKEYERRLPGRRKGTKPRYVKKDDIIFEVTTAGSSEDLKPQDNETETRRAAEKYLDALYREYETKTPATAVYEGFVNISPSGAVKQVTWTVNEAGFASTRAAIHMEEPLVAPPQKRQRFLEKTKARNREAGKAKRVLREEIVKGAG